MEKLVTREYLSSIYANKRVFVTGHTGFKGAWLTSILSHIGASVKGYALLPEYDNSLFSIMGENAKVESVIDDIRNKAKLKDEIESFQPDFVFHLAAQPLVRRSYEIPAETFEVNVFGTANVLEAIIPLEKKCSVIVITTDKVYNNKEQSILYREEDELGGYDPYSASKACAELVSQSFRNSFFNINNYSAHQKAIATARAGNVIGGGDWSKDRLIPDIIRSLSNHSLIEVRSPKSVRPWQHVLEPLCGYLLLGALLEKQPDSFSGAYNFGPFPNDHLSVKELVEISINEWGEGGWKDISNLAKPHEATLLMLDIQKAVNRLGWTPKLSATQSLKWTIEWYKQKPENKVAYTLSQIDEYLGL